MQEAVVEEMVDEEDETAVAGHHRREVVGVEAALSVVGVETDAVIHEAIPTNGEVMTADSNNRQ
jgi:hypothetical protein